EGAYGAVHRLLRQLAGARQAFAEAHDARKCVDHGETAFVRPGDQQTAIVRAQVDRAIGVALTLSPRRKPLVRRPALLAIPLLQSRRTGGSLRHDYARSCSPPPDAGG